MSDEVPVADALDQARPVTESVPFHEPDDLDPEVPSADALDQARAVPSTFEDDEPR